MLTKLPLVYEITVPYRDRMKKRQVVEFVELEVDELNADDMRDGFKVRQQWVNPPYHRPEALLRTKEILRVEGGFIYTFNPWSRVDFVASDIPRPVGTPRGHALTFIEEMLERDNERILVARAAMGVDGGTDIRKITPPPDGTVVASDRESRFDRLRELLARVVVADGQVWWRLDRPRLAIRFHDENVSADVHVTDRHKSGAWCSKGHILAPISAAAALSRTAEVMGLHCNFELAVEQTGDIHPDEITFDAGEWLLEREIMDAVAGASRHVGKLSDEGIAAWMALRDRVAGDLNTPFGLEFESTFDTLVEALRRKNVNFRHVEWRSRFAPMLSQQLPGDTAPIARFRR